jgi:hypothetical protein
VPHSPLPRSENAGCSPLREAALGREPLAPACAGPRRHVSRLCPCARSRPAGCGGSADLEGCGRARVSAHLEGHGLLSAQPGAWGSAEGDLAAGWQRLHGSRRRAAAREVRGDSPVRRRPGSHLPAGPRAPSTRTSPMPMPRSAISPPSTTTGGRMPNRRSCARSRSMLVTPTHGSGSRGC